MRKTALTLTALCLAGSLLLAGCGKTPVPEGSTAASEETGTSAETKSPSETAEAANLPSYLHYDYNYKDYLTLGKYKGVPYAPYSTEATDEEVENEIEAYRQDNAELKRSDKTVIEDGDVAHILFTGYLDGVAFEGGASGEEGYDLEIGSGSFVGTFEEQLIGKQVGTTVTLNDIVFPDTYTNNPDLAGKSTTFEVEIQYISEYVLPELNDDLAAKIAEDTGASDISTLDDLRAYIKNYIHEQKEKEKVDKNTDAVIESVISVSKISGYPEDVVKQYTDNLVNTYQSYAQMYQTDIESFIMYMFGTDYETFLKNAEEVSRQSVAREMVLAAVVEAEKMDLTEEEYAGMLSDYAAANNTTVDDLKTQYEEDVLKSYFLTQKVQTFLLENAVPAV